MGTPARTIDARIRHSRSMIEKRTTSARTGTFRIALSIPALPAELVKVTIPAAITTAAPTARAHHQWPTKAPAARTIRVGSGSLALREAKKVLNLGRTNTARIVTVTSDMIPISTGYIIAERI